ncbi:rho guanine nucleotide exchange factor 19-like [Conger conger]|uniref:rho guanine nucleotide exchange factor 19-like n=1 Tax=Conger conger TaxID=82655 RepID=UPI002A59FCA9|nr:rho guanine nucleotide exchange factor 19-like [Conger conger]
MLPGYGFSPFPDFQPHLHAFLCRGNSPDMWIPGSPESQALTEARKDRPYLRPRHHVAVCKEESLAFFDDLPHPGLDDLSFSSPDRRPLTPPPLSRQAGWVDHRAAREEDRDGTLGVGRGLRGVVSEDARDGEESGSTPSVSVFLPPVPLLSLSLSPRLSSDRESFHSQRSRSSTSSLGSEAQSTDMCPPQRRSSQGSLKEKTIRRKMRVYSPESLSDESLSSPSADSEFLFPGPSETFSEEEEDEEEEEVEVEDLVFPELYTLPCTPPPLGGIREAQAEPHPNVPVLTGGVAGDRKGGEGAGPSENSTASASQPRTVDQERRRFSASELISRLQLSQRKSSFTLKLGKSLSARAASRERQAPSSLSPEPKPSPRHRRSVGYADGAPQTPVGTWPLPPSVDSNVLLHRRCSRQSIRKDSIEEDVCDTASFTCSSRLSRFLPNSMLYQEYSDVAIHREILRQQGAEPNAEEAGHGETTPPGNLSPSSSFRSSQGSVFSLWQDIPDVRTSGQLHSFSDEERKLQEAKFELVTSEASYVRSLAIVLEHFLLSQELNDCLGAQERQWLFSKLPDVKDVSERFLQDLEHRLEEDILRFDVCDIVLAHCSALSKVYLPYVTNQAYQEQTYQRLLQENPRFRGILARLEEDPICQRLPLASFLILPFQRITRLKMLVENILKRTAPGSRDEDTATKAFNELKKLIKECNSSVQSMKRMEELIHLNKKIHFEGKIFPLISQSRWLVKHGELLEVDTQTMSISGSKFKLPTRPVYLHLFNDCLLLSRRKDVWRFVVFVHAKMGELKVKDLSQKLQGFSGFIFHLQLCEGVQLKHQILLKAHTESEKQRWITAMFPSEKDSSKRISVNQDIPQVLCIRSYQALEHDELTLEKADILQVKTVTSDGWVEGVRLSDGEQGWFPKSYVEEIASGSARLRNLRENDRIKSATRKLEEDCL